MGMYFIKAICLIVAGLLGLLAYFQVISFNVVFPVITALLAFVFGSETEKRSSNLNGKDNLP